MSKRLGYTEHELRDSPYASFFNVNMAPLPAHVLQALAKGPVAHEWLPPVQRAAQQLMGGHGGLETAYSICPDGAGRVACLTDMPGVTPQMWDWWFGWHGSHAQRYKLWHPLAHVDVRWADGRSDLSHYVGRTSRIVEYLGPTRLHIWLRFVRPASMGFDEGVLHERGEVAVCARGGLAGLPVEAVWLVHHIRPTADGAQMRSRFWIGGGNVRPIGMPSGLGRALGLAAAQLQRYTREQAQEMLIHAAQEMNHLAGFLPQLHAKFARLG